MKLVRVCLIVLPAAEHVFNSPLLMSIMVLFASSFIVSYVMQFLLHLLNIAQLRFCVHCFFLLTVK